MKQLEVKRPERKLQLVWHMSHNKEVGEVLSAIISLVNNQYSCIVELLGHRQSTGINFRRSQQEYFLFYFFHASPFYYTS